MLFVDATWCSEPQALLQPVTPTPAPFDSPSGNPLQILPEHFHAIVGMLSLFFLAQSSPPSIPPSSLLLVDVQHSDGDLVDSSQWTVQFGQLTSAPSFWSLQAYYTPVTSCRISI
ncbi:Testisin [Plecturocebus cupreus]